MLFGPPKIGNFIFNFLGALPRKLKLCFNFRRTGSLNLTETATTSFENAVLIKNKKICNAYLNEWAQIFALSENLDWTKEWCAPEFRIGT